MIQVLARTLVLTAGPGAPIGPWRPDGPGGPWTRTEKGVATASHQINSCTTGKGKNNNECWARQPHNSPVHLCRLCFPFDRALRLLPACTKDFRYHSSDWVLLRIMTLNGHNQTSVGVGRSADLVAVFSRWSLRSSRTGQTNRALDTITASRTLGPFLALKKRQQSSPAHMRQVRKQLSRGGRAGTGQFHCENGKLTGAPFSPAGPGGP